MAIFLVIWLNIIFGIVCIVYFFYTQRPINLILGIINLIAAMILYKGR